MRKCGLSSLGTNYSGIARVYACSTGATVTSVEESGALKLGYGDDVGFEMGAKQDMEGPGDRVLNGWKEIANYIGRSTRTVQRWERFGLPIRRPSGAERSAVLAIAEEIDDWLRSAPRLVIHSLPKTGAASNVPGFRQNIEKYAELRMRCEQLCRAHIHALRTLADNVNQLRASMAIIADDRRQPGQKLSIVQDASFATVLTQPFHSKRPEVLDTTSGLASRDAHAASVPA